MTSSSPAFGQADLSNCERELIHLAGSVQPHGVLIEICPRTMRVRRVSASCSALLGRQPQALLERPLAELDATLAAWIAERLDRITADDPLALRCTLAPAGDAWIFEGAVHRLPSAIVIEIEPAEPAAAARAASPRGPSVATVALPEDRLTRLLEDAIGRFSASSAVGTLADCVVQSFRELLGYDRVMVYKFDPDGHGKVIAEARDPRLESLLGHHYPASDIPQRARELYVRNRLRVLVNVDDVAAPIVPRLDGTGAELDMSMCYLRSMSPLHLQYLRNMGVTATVVVSLVREGRLWGLVACHHYAPRNLRHAVRAAGELLAEAAATRIAAIENYAHAQVAIQARRLEQRLIEATSTEGDWRLALFRNPQTLLQPLDATAAALFIDGEVLTAGEAPSTPELRALLQWVDSEVEDGLFISSSIARDNPALESLTSTASGVLAIRLSTSKPEYLMWLRREQLQSVTWAGDPYKPTLGDDPSELSPRRSFAAWSEIVRGTALPWSAGEIAVARAFGASLIDIIVQINAVRLLIAEHQIRQVRADAAKSGGPLVVLDPLQRPMFASDALLALLGCSRAEFARIEDVAQLFGEASGIHPRLERLARERQAWRGDMHLRARDGSTLPVGVRAEVVTARDGTTIGYFLICEDMTEARRVADARRHLEDSLEVAGARPVPGPNAGTLDAMAREPDKVIGAILTNASLAAMDIADGTTRAAVAPLLQEVETSTRRAADLYARIRGYSARRGD